MQIIYPYIHCQNTKTKRNQIETIMKYFEYYLSRFEQKSNAQVEKHCSKLHPDKRRRITSRIIKSPTHLEFPFVSRTRDRGRVKVTFLAPSIEDKGSGRLRLLISRSVGSGYRISASMDYPLKLSSRKSVSKGNPA